MKKDVLANSFVFSMINHKGLYGINEGHYWGFMKTINKSFLWSRIFGSFITIICFLAINNPAVLLIIKNKFNTEIRLIYRYIELILTMQLLFYWLLQSSSDDTSTKNACM